jgi:uncharacterized metal-binding protein YceD (DUF177 family)
MRAPPPELSRPLRADRVPAAGCEERIAADAEECTRLAARLGVPALHALTASLVIEPARGKGLRVHGAVRARVTQTCVVTLEEFDTEMHVEIERFFLPATAFHGDDQEAADEDVDLIRDGEIDLGELVGESLALAIDPYPRKPGVAFSPVSSGGGSDRGESRTPFAELARLRGGPRRR